MKMFVGLFTSSIFILSIVFRPLFAFIIHVNSKYTIALISFDVFHPLLFPST